jgi:hypothetical protein
MAEVVVTLRNQEDLENLNSGNLNPNELQIEIDKFSTKHKDIVDLFEGNFFVKDEKWGDEKDGFDNSMFILFSGNEDVEISTRDTYRASNDKPFRDKAILRFFSNIKNETIKKAGGGDISSSFGFGENGFPDEFYQDLFKLTSKVFHHDGTLTWSISTTVVGYEGYYLSYITLTGEGLIQKTVYYEGEEDGDIW